MLAITIKLYSINIIDTIMYFHFTLKDDEREKEKGRDEIGKKF